VASSEGEIQVNDIQEEILAETVGLLLEALEAMDVLPDQTYLIHHRALTALQVQRPQQYRGAWQQLVDDECVVFVQGGRFFKVTDKGYRRIKEK
jgi:hypothetical protein